MRELRFVGPDAGGDHVIVAEVDGDERFRLVVDGDLREAAATTGQPAEVAAPPHEPAAEVVTISPREIQVRVRAGESPQALANEADLPVEKILVFAGPVLAERERIIGESRRGRATRRNAEGQLVLFGEAVDGRFAAHGIDPSAVRWDACRHEDGHWLISATWRGGEIDRTAQWSFALAGRMVSPLDETAADLLSDRPIRPIAVPVPDPEPAAAEVAPDADTGPLPSVSRSKQLWFEQPPAEPVDEPLPLAFATEPEPALAGANRRGGARRPMPMVHPPAADDETDEQKAARARIPSWDDIMLGVRRKRD